MERTLVQDFVGNGQGESLPDGGDLRQRTDGRAEVAASPGEDADTEPLRFSTSQAQYLGNRKDPSWLVGNDGVDDLGIPDGSGDGPHLAFSAVIMLTESWEGARGMIPSMGTRPTVGFSPTTPANEAGVVMDPSVSVPRAAMHRLAATATAEPELEPNADVASR